MEALAKPTTEQHIIIDEATMQKVVLHRVGNKSQDEGVRTAVQPLNIDEHTQEVLQHYFLGNFNLEEVYEFNHEIDLSMNEVYVSIARLFENVEDNFMIESIVILKHLYEKSNHIKIKGGELYVAYFKDCIVDDELVDAIGIFKTEDKDTYLKPKLDENREWTVGFDEGVSIGKLGKGCLVFNTHQETGFTVVSVDLKGADAKYWKDEFLTITHVHNDSFFTKAYLDLCKDFANKQFKGENLDEKTDFVNRTRDYFQYYKEFDEQQFKEMIFEQDMEKMDAFEARKQDFQEKLGIEDTAEEGFSINKKAAQKASRGLKDTIELDTQLKIKVLSSTAQAEGFLQRGYDEEREMHFYKLYFNSEK